MKRKMAFGEKAQTSVIIAMVISFVLIIQEFSEGLYQAGLVILIVSSLSQMAFSNISPKADFKESRNILIISFTVVAIVFALGIFLAPILIKIGR